MPRSAAPIGPFIDVDIGSPATQKGKACDTRYRHRGSSGAVARLTWHALAWAKGGASRSLGRLRSSKIKARLIVYLALLVIAERFRRAPLTVTGTRAKRGGLKSSECPGAAFLNALFSNPLRTRLAGALAGSPRYLHPRAGHWSWWDARTAQVAVVGLMCTRFWHGFGGARRFWRTHRSVVRIDVKRPACQVSGYVNCVL